MGFFKKNWGKVAGGVIGGPVGFLFGGQMDKNREEAALRAGFDPYSGMPTHPEYIGMEPGDFGAMYDRVNFNRAPMEKLSQEAMRTGPSRAAMLAMEGNEAQTLLNADKARRMGANLSSQAQAGLAAKGGLMSGAAERIQKSGRDKTMDLVQQANALGQQGRINIGMEDEKNRLAGLGQAANANLAAGQFDLSKATNKSRGLMDLYKNKSDFNMGKYQTQMQTWASGKQADATTRAGGGGKK